MHRRSKHAENSVACPSSIILRPSTPLSSSFGSSGYLLVELYSRNSCGEKGLLYGSVMSLYKRWDFIDKDTDWE